MSHTKTILKTIYQREQKGLIIQHWQRVISENYTSTDKWTAQKAVDQQLSELNDEIETLKDEKRKLNSQLADVSSKDQEIKALEQEVKSLVKVGHLLLLVFLICP